MYELIQAYINFFSSTNSDPHKHIANDLLKNVFAIVAARPFECKNKKSVVITTSLINDSNKEKVFSLLEEEKFKAKLLKSKSTIKYIEISWK